MKNAMIWLLIMIITYTGIIWSGKIYDETWENRAKNAGYYDTLDNKYK